jgi:UPF0042 nucleotide-binding protein
MQFILLTGLSGAGKTASLRHLEDMGCPYVDNLPPAMILRFMEVWQSTSPRTQTVVLAVDIRSGDLFDAHALRNLIASARAAGTNLRVLFLEASDDELLNRFKETRREHPLQHQTGDLQTAIAQERERLQPLREMADIILDTTGLRLNALRERINQTLLNNILDEVEQKIRSQIYSFGFKRGVPRDADIVLDVRFLPNPFYINDIRFQTGLQSAVQEFVLGAPVTKEFLSRTMDMLLFLMPYYQSEGKRRLVIGIGCTGGAHRSVAIAEAIGASMRAQGYDANVRHRDIDLETEHWKHL